jgi:hypothetical protein
MHFHTHIVNLHWKSTLQLETSGFSCRRVVEACEQDIISDEDAQEVARINSIEKLDLSSSRQVHVRQLQSNAAAI